MRSLYQALDGSFHCQIPFIELRVRVARCPSESEQWICFLYCGFVLLPTPQCRVLIRLEVTESEHNGPWEECSAKCREPFGQWVDEFLGMLDLNEPHRVFSYVVTDDEFHSEETNTVSRQLSHLRREFWFA